MNQKNKINYSTLNINHEIFTNELMTKYQIENKFKIGY